MPPAARPKYPPLMDMLPNTIVHYMRAPFLATIFLFAVYPAYRAVAKWWPYEEVYFYLAGTMIIHFVLYFGLNGFFFFCDKNGWLAQYKLPRPQRTIPPEELVRRTVSQGLLGQIFAAPVTLYLIYNFVIPNPVPRLNDVPDPVTIYRHFLCAAFCNTIGFYWAHRLCHESTFLYRTVHKQHHQYIGSIGFAAEYAHPFEQVIANQGPTALYCVLTSVHPLIWFVWLTWRLEQTYEAHSGYCFKGTIFHKLGLTNSEAAEFHDYHHSENKGNYGDPFSDWLFGSMDSWLNHLAKK
jgi:sterol desaturase/sphingolipid hydroxylase (fatty acid hydroxylase superfamily)